MPMPSTSYQLSGPFTHTQTQFISPNFKVFEIFQKKCLNFLLLVTSLISRIPTKMKYRNFRRSKNKIMQQPHTYRSQKNAKRRLSSMGCVRQMLFHSPAICFQLEVFFWCVCVSLTQVRIYCAFTEYNLRLAFGSAQFSNSYIPYQEKKSRKISLVNYIYHTYQQHFSKNPHRRGLVVAARM